MNRILGMSFLILGCLSAFGTTRMLVDRVQVTPTNATNHTLLLSYGQTNDLFTLIMPSTKEDYSFNSASLTYSNAVRQFRIPIRGSTIKGTEGKDDIVLIYFWMDRETARDCRLTVSFSEGSKGTDYNFNLKDFLAMEEKSSGK